MTICVFVKEFSEFRFPVQDWHFTGYDNNGYTACRCFFSNMVDNIGSSMTMIRGKYQRLIKGFEYNKKYTCVSFYFRGIESLIQAGPFKIRFYKDSLCVDNVSFPNQKKLSYKINDNIEMSLSIGQKYEIKKWDKFHLDQEPSFIFRFGREQSINQIVSFLVRVRCYLEFVCQSKQPLSLSHVVMSGAENSSVELLYDCSLSVPKDGCNSESLPSFFVDHMSKNLDGWLRNYKKHEQSINIWRKTVTNNNIDENDRALWFAQAFESLVLSNKELLSESIKHISEKDKKRREEKKPNIKEMLLCLDERQCFYDFISSAKNQFFSTVKDYRNGLVHCKPEKQLTMGRVLNSRRIIETAFYQTMKIVMNLEWVPTPVSFYYSENETSVEELERVLRQLISHYNDKAPCYKIKPIITQRFALSSMGFRSFELMLNAFGYFIDNDDCIVKKDFVIGAEEKHA